MATGGSFRCRESVRDWAGEAQEDGIDPWYTPAKALENENAHPRVSIYASPLSRGDVHGRIRFDGIATAKTWL
jgi:hypothetical protein